MRLSYRWLKDFIDIEWSPYELADKLTMAGLEVDSVEKIETFDAIVGEVAEIKRQNNLLVCKTNIGYSTINIVTADSSIRQGEKLPLVLAGGRLDNKVIERKRFGDTISDGMFLSAEELGLEESSSELLRLDSSFKNGTSLREIDEFDDYIIELELTPNRADALSVLGVARDVMALSGSNITIPNSGFSVLDKKISDIIDVKVEDYDSCPRYTLYVADVKVRQSPFFIRMRLLKSGIRVINNIVDITNYVLMALGQPMHAFDLNKINGDITVRKAKNGEKIVALDGKEYKLDDSMLVIADERSPIAIAGVMGGEFSSVDSNTKTVALESAHFNPVNVRLTSKKLKLHTESSHRFERGVDPNLCLDASKYALSLMEEWASAKVYHGYIDNRRGDFSRKSVIVSFGGINKLLGSSYNSNEIAEVLISLNMDVERIGKEKARISIPTYRFDIESEADIAEEVARIKGYDTIDPTYPVVETRFKRKEETERLSDEIAKVLADLGLFETKNYSFVDDGKLKLFDESVENFVYIKNPLIDTQNVMRTNLIVSLMDVLNFNISKGARSVPIFEIGKVFYRDEEFAKEFVNVGFLLWGVKGFNWYEKLEYFDFYDLKGFSEVIGGLLGKRFGYVHSSKSFLHPKRSADIVISDEEIGYIGELHPDLYKEYDIKFDKKNRVLIGEINLSLAISLGKGKIMYEHLPKLPTVWRDLAIVVNKDVNWSDVEAVVTDTEYVYKVALFDVYSKLDEDNKVSLAFRVVLKRDDKTFTDEEIDRVIRDIYGKLRSKFGAKLRGE